MRIALLASVLWLVSTLPAEAEDLGHCTAINQDAARLACYDALAGRTPVTAGIAAPVSEAATVPQAAAAEHRSAPEQPPVASAPAPDVISAHIVGTFNGWHEGTEFTLDNGQVWRVAEEDIATYRAHDNPAVKIKKGFLGSYRLEIDALNARVKVERVR